MIFIFRKALLIFSKKSWFALVIKLISNIHQRYRPEIFSVELSPLIAMCVFSRRNLRWVKRFPGLVIFSCFSYKQNRTMLLMYIYCRISRYKLKVLYSTSCFPSEPVYSQIFHTWDGRNLEKYSLMLVSGQFVLE